MWPINTWLASEWRYHQKCEMFLDRNTHASHLILMRHHSVTVQRLWCIAHYRGHTSFVGCWGITHTITGISAICDISPRAFWQGRALRGEGWKWNTRVITAEAICYFCSFYSPSETNPWTWATDQDTESGPNNCKMDGPLACCCLSENIGEK